MPVQLLSLFLPKQEQSPPGSEATSGMPGISSELWQPVNQSYTAAVPVTWLIKLEPTERFIDLKLTPVSRPTWKVTMFTAVG